MSEDPTLKIFREQQERYFDVLCRSLGLTPENEQNRGRLRRAVRSAFRVDLQTSSEALKYSARREAGWHVHIVLLSGRWKKAWLYLVLAGKNLLQALGLRKDDAPRMLR